MTHRGRVQCALGKVAILAQTHMFASSTSTSRPPRSTTTSECILTAFEWLNMNACPQTALLTRTHARTRTHPHARTHAHAHAHARTHTHAHAHAHTHTRTCARTHTHTNTHTHALAQFPTLSNTHRQ